MICNGFGVNDKISEGVISTAFLSAVQLRFASVSVIY